MRRYSSTDFIMLTLLSVSVCVVRYENSKNQQQWNRTSMFQHTARQQRWVQVFFLFSNITSSLSSVLSMTSLSCSDAHTDTVLLSKRQKKNYVVFGKTSIFRDFLCLFICLFFLSSRARFMAIFGICGGRENRVRMCVSGFFGFL